MKDSAYKKVVIIMPYKDKLKEKERKKAYYAENKEKICAYRRACYKKRKGGLTLEEIDGRRLYQRVRYKKNIEERRGWSRNYYQKNKEKIIEHRKCYRDAEHRERKYGITKRRYENMLYLQGGKCRICGNLERDRRLSVDHCHNTGKVRGLLCRRCNLALGFFDDDIDRVKKALTYLKMPHDCRYDLNDEIIEKHKTKESD